MKLDSTWLCKINKYYKTVFFFPLFLIGGSFSVLQASNEVTEILYMRAINSSDLNSLTESQIKNAKLHIEEKEDNKEDNKEPQIEFISEKTKFKYDGKAVSFKEQPSNFFDKIKKFHNSVFNVKGHNKYNHLCLTLYVIYQEPATQTFQIAESPLFAKKSKKYILNDQGDLVINPDRKVIFYTKTTPLDSDQWAYFTTFNGLAPEVKEDPNVFPISTDSYECNSNGCNVVCKKFYHQKTDDKCPPHHSNKCRHTEPHALYHIIKHSKELFYPLINNAVDVKNVKSVGLRFFSYYQACSSCVELLLDNQQIEISDNKTLKLNYMFYFHSMYGPLVIEIITTKIKLYNTYNQYLFRGFLIGDKVYCKDAEEEEDPSNNCGHSKGYFKLPENLDLLNNKIVSIYYLGLKRLRIYLVK